jgi:phosphatidylethanolamine/phosphatidyl-N-methylethanolamine N-methyltransferase
VVPKHFHGHVLELGPGTGSITNALLERGVSPGKILAVEFCGEMIKVLRKRFPTVVTIHGDAGSLRKLLTEHFGRDFEPLEYIISSLPLKSLPESKVREIAGEIDHVLSPTGKLLQFTYDLSSSSVSHFSKLSHRHSRIVWRNLPPARINLFEKH